MTIQEKSFLIIKDLKNEEGINPIQIFKRMTKKDYIDIHGPEHHILDGACILVAYKNAGGDINLDEALNKIMNEGLRMPGAMCGLWGVCGAVTSIGAALSIIDKTGPLSNDGSWGNHMEFTSNVVKEVGEVNGPRCCKRDALIAFKNAINYINKYYNVKLQYEKTECEFKHLNKQCIRKKCPFYE